ncbi:MAG: HYR domain-containing protein, partial [Bacteroidota bacterium]
MSSSYCRTKLNLALTILASLTFLFTSTSAWTQAPTKESGPAYQSPHERYKKGGAYEGLNPEKEMIDKRDATSKTFDMGDGNFTTITSGGPVHYKAPSGEMQDIDPRIRMSVKDGFAYENVTNTLQSFFPHTLNGGNGVLVKGTGLKMRMGMDAELSFIDTLGKETVLEKAATVSPSLDGKKVIYPNFFSVVDNEYVVGNNRVKNNYVINSLPVMVAGKRGYLAISEYVELPAGWTLGKGNQSISKREGVRGGISILNPANEPIYKLPTPDIYEKNDIYNEMYPTGRTRETYLVERVGDRYRVTLLIDLRWLDRPGRDFPVVADPTVIYNGQFGGWQNSAGAFLDNVDFVFTASFFSNAAYRGWIRWNTTSIPDNSRIDDVDARFWLNGAQINTTSSSTTVRDVTGTPGPYAQFNGGAYNDFGNGVNYQSFNPGWANNFYGYFDLGGSADARLETLLPQNYFQVGMATQGTWKRFEADLSQLRVVYTTCSPLNAGSIGSNQTICSGGNLGSFGNFASASGGIGPYNYQWQQQINCSGGWSNIGGATGTTYNPPALTQTRCYRRVVTDQCNSGSAISNVITVTVVADPSISASGAGTICVGGNRTLSSTTSGGTGSCSYQWQRATSSNGPWTNVGGNSSSYNTGGLSQTFFYRVQRICNGVGCNDPFSNVVQVTVVADPSISASGGGTICQGGNRTLTSATSGGTGSCSYQWQRSTSSSGPWANVGGNSSTYNTGTLNSTFFYRVQRICNGSGCNDPFSNVVQVTVVPDPSVSLSGAGTICTGGNRTITASASNGTGCSFVFQRSTGPNGPWATVSNQSSANYNTGTLTQSFYYRVQRLCSGSGCSDPISNVILVTVVADPSISISSSGTICTGGNRTLTASTSGGTGCSTQWQVATSPSGPWTNVGGNSSSYNTGTLTATRYYRAQRVCTGSGCGTATSNTVTVTVVPDPTISASGGGTICTGGNRTLSSSTSGGTGCSYQWQVATSSSGPWSNVGGNSATYNTGTLTATRFYRVRRVCTGSGCGTATSNVLTVTVVPDPSVSLSGGGTICTGGNQTITASASNGTGCTFIFQRSTISSSGPWTSVSTQASATYNTGTLTQTTFYRVQRSCSGSGCSDPFSNVVTVTVVPDPSISVSSSGTICTGGNRTLTASTSGGTGCSTQWQVATSPSGPWTNVGGNSSSYNTGTLTATRYYRAQRVCTGNGCGTATSNTVTVTVVPDPTISASGSATICTGGNQTLSSSTSGGTGCSYQWQVATSSSGPWSNVGGNSATYNTGTLTATRFYRVRRVCTGSGCGTATSNVLTVTVVPDPSVSISGGGIFCPGDDFTLTATASGGTGCSFQWQSAPTPTGPWSNVGSNSSTYNTGALTTTTYYRALRNCSGSGCNQGTSNVVSAIRDNIAPTAVCQAVTVQLNAAGNGSVTANQVNNGSTDNCTISNLSVSPNTFNCSDVGANTVTLTVTDNSNNSATCTATVTVEDNVPPVANCQNVTVQLNAAGNGSVTAAQVNNGSSDACGIASLSVAPNTFGCADVGANTVTLTVTDVNNNTSTCTATATVQDNVAPNAVCQNVTVQLNAAGNGSVTAAQVDGGSTDACGIASRSVSPNSFNCGNVGPNTVTLTVTDNNNNVSTCTATVTVEDNVPPVAICQPVTVQLDANGNGSITAAQVDGGSNDACGIASLAVNPSTFSCANVGGNTVTLTVTDNNNNVSTCTATITVQDNVPPIAVCQDVTVQLDASGNGSITAAQVDGGSSDNCAIASLAVSPSTFGCSNVGANTVTLTVTDVNNNVSTCTSVVTVEDNVPPIALCQNVTVALDSSGNGSTTAAAVDGGSNDACGIASLSLDITTFGCGDLGPNTVTLTVTDVNNNVSTCTSTVTVIDTIGPPAFVCPPSVTLPAVLNNCNAQHVWMDPVVTDNCSQVTVSSASPGASIIKIGNVNIGLFPVGTNVVTVTATDGSQNTTTCTFTVTVEDLQNPTITGCPTGPIVVSTTPGQCFGNPTFGPINASDNCPGVTLTGTNLSGSNFPVGTTSVTFTATDASNNVSTCSFDVTVNDNEGPTTVCNNLTVQLNAAGSATITVADVDGGTTDACGLASVTASPLSFNCANVGPNTVTLTATDVNNNTSTCTSTVTVEDITVPTVVCQNVTLQLDASGFASLNAIDVDGGSTDNCTSTANLARTVNPSSFNCSNVGQNTVTLTVTDASNNSSSCTATVTVQDNIAPTAVCQNITINLTSTAPVVVAPSQIDNGSNDACGIASLSLSPNTFSCATPGVNNVTLTVTDNNNNVSTCNATVTVQDNVAPIAVCQNTTVQLDASGNASITAADVDGGSSDACGTVTLSASPTAFTCANVGANSVTLTVTDNSNNTATCTATVTVQDNIAPTAVCQNATVQLDGFGNAAVTAAQINNGSNDNCGIANLSVSPAAFSCSNVGPNPVTLTVTDVNGNTSTCTATVSVEDNVAPTANCQNVTVQLNASGNASISTLDVNNNSSDNCGIASLSLSNTSFTCADVGSNSVTLTVTDVNSNVSTCTSTVTVEDNIAPNAVCQSVTVQLDAAGNASIVASDIDGGSTDNCSIASISANQTAFTCANVGNNPVTLSVTDVNGNVSTCIASVVVQDNAAPVVTCQNITVALNSSGIATITPASVGSATDNCTANPTLSIDNNIFTCSDVGPNNVTVTATDVNNNASTCIAVVTVEDNTPPTALCANATVQLDASGNGSISAAQINNGSSDNCGISGFSLNTTSFTCADVGANTVVLTVTDVNGNTSTCSGSVTVEDNVAPTAVCQSLTVQLGTGSSVSITAADVDGGSSDNCGIASLAVSPNSFGCANVGQNTVTLTVTDVNGNTATCNSTVTVVDSSAPTAVCQNATVQLDGFGNASITPADVDGGSGDNCGGNVSLSVSPSSFTCADLGANTVTLTVTDPFNNTSTCTATVTVEDNVAPTALCQPVIVQLNGSGSATIAASDVDGGSSDNCSVASLSLSQTSFGCADVGANAVTLTVTDGSSNTSTCTATVTVEDNIAPNAVCANVTVQLDASGNGTTTAAATDGGSTDNCGIGSLSLSQTAFTCADIGNNSETLTVTDVNGNTNTCTVTVTVEDNVAPNAVCQAVTVQLDAAGNGSVNASDVNGGSTDACGIANLAVSPNSFTCSDVGANTVTLTVTDVNNNTSTCTATVTVEDNVPPTALCQSVTIQLDANGNGSTTAAAVDAGSNDACGIASLSLGQTNFGCADVGQNIITLTATDNNGNTGTCQTVITVEDNIAPNAICQNITVTLPGSGSVTLTPADVDGGSNDNCGIANLAISPMTFNCANSGNNAVTLTVTDVNGNVSSCTANVTVNDTVAPVAVCQNITLQLGASGNASITPADVDGGSSDNCAITSLSASPNTFGCADVGANNVVLTVTDASNNVSTCTATVTVEDNLAPTAVCLNLTVQLNASGQATITPADVDGGTTDNCGIASLAVNPNAFDCNTIGNNTVILTATDVNGNLGTCLSTVTVVDTTPATAVCQNITVQLDALGQANITAADIDGGSGDNCTVASITAAPTSFGCANVGPNNVTLTVTDVNNNVSSCVAIVTVEDNVAPVAVCQDITVQLDQNGNASITGAQVDGGSNDACGIASVTVAPNAFTCADVGFVATTVTVTDVNNNVSTCVANVFVEDTLAPDAVCTSVAVFLNNQGIAIVNPADINNGSTDNCAIANFELSRDTFNCADVNVSAQSFGLLISEYVEGSGNNRCIEIFNPTSNTVDLAAENVELRFYFNGSFVPSVTIPLTGTIVSGGVHVICDAGADVPFLARANQTSTAAFFDGNDAVELVRNGQRQDLFASIGQNPGTAWTTGNKSTLNQTLVRNPVILNGWLFNVPGFVVLGSQWTNFPQDYFQSLGFHTVANGFPTVTLTVTDVNGNSNSCSASVAVFDTTAPVATCRDITVFLDATGNYTIDDEDVNNATFDACGIHILEANPKNFDCSTLGANTVTLAAADISLNFDTCFAIVTVIDSTSPVAICQNITVNLDANGQATITPADISNGSSDACGIDTLFLDRTSFGCGDIGVNPVLLTVQDSSNNTAACQALVQVTDTVAPVAICQNITAQLDVSGTVTISPADVDGGSTDACGIVSSSLDVSTFSCSDVGVNTVTLTVLDGNANVSSCQATVTVEDNVAPNAICQNVTVQLDASGNAAIVPGNLNGGSSDACGIATLSLSQSAFTCADVGANTVTLTVTDVNNNTSTCTGTVTVVDNTVPNAICQDVTVYLNGGGTASVTTADLDNGSNDACGIASLSVNPNTFGCGDVAGSNAAVLTVTDNNGNVATCVSNVTVIDSVAPVATCQNVTVFLSAIGTASITAQDVDGGTTDACGLSSLSIDNSSFTCADVGTNTVTLTATDNNGNVSSCTATVTVNDTFPVTAVCQNVTVQLDASGNASITASDIDGGSNDNCGIASISAAPTSFTCADVGANTVTLTVTDINSNTSTCTATVTVEDNIAPTAVCQSVTVALDAAGNATVAAQDVDNGSTDNCGIASLALSQTNFGCTDVGNNLVLLTVTDVNGNSSICNATVTVNDTVAPVAICQNVTLNLDANGQASLTVADVDGGTTDNCGLASVSINPTTFDCSNVGANTVTLTAVDLNGNVATCTGSVTLNDNTPPVAVCQSVTVVLDASGNASITAADVDGGSSDNCAIASRSVSQSSFGCADVGSNNVTLTDTDINGNTSTCVAAVTVVDNVPPTALCQNVTVALDASGSATITAADVDGGSSDNCAISSRSVSQTNFGCADVGSNLVILTVSDVNGNTASCNATVTVIDSVTPTAVCQNITVTLDATGNATITAADVDGGSGDNCGLASLSISPSTFNCSNVGPNAVTLTVTDQNNNTSTCTATVTVIEGIPPVAICQNITVQLDASGNASITAADVDGGSLDNCGIASISASPTSFTCADVGANAVTLTVTDLNNNTSTCTATVTVEDNISPTALCQNVTVQIDANGNASITASDIDNGSNDNCGVANVSVSPSSFTCADVGTNAVTLTVTDVNGNVSNCQASVNVQDNVAPVAVCQNVTVQLSGNGTGSITAADLDGGSTDNCGISSLVASNTAFDCSDVGANNVTLTVTDINGNVSTCTALVTVEDNVAPNAICQPVTVQLNAAGTASVSAANVNSGSSDACGIASLSLSQTAFTCADVGSNSVTLTVADVNGNVSTCTATVTVEDNTSPVAICTNANVTLDASGTGSITAADIDGGSFDNCGISSLVATQTSFDCSNVGINLVTLIVTDSNGNVSTCQSLVNVADNTAPNVVCQNVTVTLDANGSASIAPADIDNGSTDNCGIASLNLDQTSFGCGDVGSNTVTLTATDVNGNTANCTATVTVVDSTTPTAVCQNLTVALDANGNASITAADVDGGSSDNCAIASLTASPTSFTCAEVGANTVTLTVIDQNSNTSTCTATVTVEDNIAPTAVCQNLTVALDANGNASITPNDIDNGSADNCGIAGLSLSQTAFGCGDIGQNVVTLTVTDVNGNVSTCQSVVEIEDNTAPIAVCQNLTVQLDADGDASIGPQDVDNGSSDNCGIASLSLDNTSFDCANVGLNTVTLTVTDFDGNTSTCTATVTVEDNVAPTAICQNITVQLDVTGNANILPGNVNGGSMDACGIANLAISQSSFTCLDVGVNPVTLTVTDVNGNVSTCIGNVTVEDNVAPVAVCQDITVALDPTGNATITASDVDGGSNDACGNLSLSVSPTGFTCSDVGGTNPVILTVSDGNGNTAQCVANVTVIDTVAPLALCQNITVQLNAAGVATIAAADVDGGSNDACGLSSVTVSNTLFGCADVGANAVTLTVTDQNNNVSTCTATVTVEDNVAPVAVCQSITLGLDPTGNATITPADVDGGSNDACGIASLSVTPDAFTCLDVGNNTSVLTVTDVNGNVSQCTSAITVIDTVPPLALCNDLTIYLDAQGAVSITPQDVDAGSNDACGVASLAIDPSDFFCGDVTGTNPVLLTVTDVNNNASNCISVVTVLDTIAPVAICQDVTVQLDVTGNAVLVADSVNNGSNDACGLDTLVVSPNAFTCADVGVNTTTLTVTDVNGNTSTCTANVTVEDNIAPIALCQDVTVQLDPTGNGSVTPQEVDNGSSDACGIASLVLGGITNYNCADVGDTTIFVLLTVTDVNNNFSTCISNITVEDTVAPIALCNDLTVSLDNNGNGSITVQDVDGGSSDACGIASITISDSTFNCADVGLNPITLTVTDVNNNVSTCVANITVEDTIAPVAICQDITVQLDANGDASITGADLDGGSTDNCAIASLVATPNIFGCANVGANPVTLTVTDVNNNVSTCTSVVTVEDNVPPVAICVDVTVQLDANGGASITPADVDGGSNDA